MYFSAKKSYSIIFSFFLALFSTSVFVFPVGAQAADLLPLGAKCTRNAECASGDCESSSMPDGSDYCDCNGSDDCSVFGEDESWKCIDGADALYDLDYCKSETTGRVEYKGPTKDPSFLDALLDTQVAANEIQKMITKPVTKISIPGVTFSDPQVTIENGTTYQHIPYLSEYIVALYKYAVLAFAIIAVLMILISGVIWMSSGGNPEQITQAKTRIGHALIGLILTVGSYTILFIINPELVQFKYLKVKYVEQVSYEESLGSSHNDANPLYSGAGVAGNCSSFDATFEKYAPCLGADASILKAIASVESGCNPNIENSSGFVGMGQTRPDYCVGIFRHNKYEKLTSYCTKEDLKNPNVGVAVIALLQRDAVTKIRKYCSGATPAEQGAAFHAYNNVPAAALRMIKNGCKNKEDFISYYHADMAKAQSYVNTSAYFKKYGNLLKPKTDPGYKESLTAYLRAIGEAKINYAISHAGPVFASLGGNINNTPAGTCPLGTNNPF